MSTRLDLLKISSWRCDGQPNAVWACCLHEYDEGSKVFTGTTQRDAVVYADELLKKLAAPAAAAGDVDE